MSLFMHTGTRLLALAGACGLLAGCAAAGPAGGPKAVVHGKVTYNGQPVENGTITFNPASNMASSASTTIVDGNYEVTVLQGKYQVLVANPVNRSENTTLNYEEYMKNREAMLKEYRAATRGGGTPRRVSKGGTEEISPTAPGNKALFEIDQPDKTLDIKIGKAK
jgi:hypothetical protein